MQNLGFWYSFDTGKLLGQDGPLVCDAMNLAVRSFVFRKQVPLFPGGSKHYPSPSIPL